MGSKGAIIPQDEISQSQKKGDRKGSAAGERERQKIS